MNDRKQNDPLSLPSHAPFTPEQAASLNQVLPRLSAEQMHWLSGFFAGYLHVECERKDTAALAEARVPVTILFGTESGNSEALADEAKKQLSRRGFKVTLKDMGGSDPAFLAKSEILLVIVSTWGEGDPPERAAEFYRKVMNDEGLKLTGTKFAVCGLGDTSYNEFCKMGKDFDRRFEELGGARLMDRVDCDVDYEPVYQRWFGSVIKELEDLASPPFSPATEIRFSSSEVQSAERTWSRSNPFQAELLERINLNGTGSSKETYHLELSLEGSGLTYLPGDSLGVKPRNCPDVIEHLIQACGFRGDEEVNRADGSASSLRGILIEELDSTTLSQKLVQEYARLSRHLSAG